MSNSYQPRCYECGRFCKPYDSGRFHGSYYDDEPPDTEYFCESCVKKIMKHPENVIIGCWWVKPLHVVEAESMRK